jgi:hypothetical protein
MEGDECKYVFSDGSTYVGQVVDGQFHGQGVVYMKSGGEFRGEFKNGVMTSKDYYYADGLKFSEGYLKDNRLLFKNGQYTYES